MAIKKTTSKKKTASKAKTASKKTTGKKAASKKAVSKKTATKKAVSKKAVSKKKTASKKTSPKKATAKKAGTKKSSKAMAKKGTGSRKAASGKVAKKAAPKKTAVLKTGPRPPKKKVLVVPKNSVTKQYTQNELFECIRGYCGFSTKAEAREFYERFSEMLRKALRSGYKLSLPGLGKMHVRRTKARRGINPATREPIMIPARKKVAFRPNKAMKDAVL